MLIPFLLLSLAPQAPLAEVHVQEVKPLLRVHVVDELGTPVAVQWEPRHRTGLWGEESWPEEPCVVVIPMRSCAEDAYLERSRLDGVAFENGDVGYLLEFERQYYVGVYGGDVPFEPSVVCLQKYESLRELTLSIRHEERTPIETKLRMTESKTLLFEDERTGIVLVDRGNYWHRVPALPRGQYRVHVQDVPEYGYHGEFYARVHKGRRTTTVDTREGASFQFDTDLPAGARLELLVSGEVTRAELESEDYDLMEQVTQPDLGPVAVLVDLVPEQGASHRVLFPIRELEGRRRVTEVTSRLSLGDFRVSEVVPTGDYTLVARLPGGRTVAAPVSLSPHELRRVVLQFPPPSSVEER